jgi:hypothetical protein
MLDTSVQIAFAALCYWREGRGSVQMMTAIGAVNANRMKRHKISQYADVVTKFAYSSMTDHGDPQLILFPLDTDTFYAAALIIAASVSRGTLDDPTQGATLYYDDSIPFPEHWNKSKVQATVKIGRLNFYREL